MRNCLCANLLLAIVDVIPTLFNTEQASSSHGWGSEISQRSPVYHVLHVHQWQEQSRQQTRKAVACALQFMLSTTPTYRDGFQITVGKGHDAAAQTCRECEAAARIGGEDREGDERQRQRGNKRVAAARSARWCVR